MAIFFLLFVDYCVCEPGTFQTKAKICIVSYKIKLYAFGCRVVAKYLINNSRRFARMEIQQKIAENFNGWKAASIVNKFHGFSHVSYQQNIEWC